MKQGNIHVKYTYRLIIACFVFALLALNVNHAGAAECAPGDVYNSRTGDPCPHEIAVPPVIKCMPATLSMGSRGSEVKVFQQKMFDAGFAPGKIDGIYGPLTSEAALKYFKVYPPCQNPESEVVINAVSGPQTLHVNQQGTWTVSAYSKSGNNLYYYVTWGDEKIGSNKEDVATSVLSLFSQEATFTHTYARAGTYKPTFTVQSPNTIRCIQAPCPVNGGSAQVSLSVNVGEGVVATEGTLHIDPSNVSVNIGSNVRVKAYYEPSMFPCNSADVSCVTGVPLREVFAQWSTSNPKIVEVQGTQNDCENCEQRPYYFVIGNSAGTTELRATYAPLGGTPLTATAKVVVN